MNRTAYGSVVCPNCIKNESYPNRFMFNLLTQIGIDFQREYSPDWIRPKRFDFYFVLNDRKYIIEMDGGFHRIETVKDTDRYKDSMAKEHNVEVIRIDCDYAKTDKRFLYIKESISKSRLYTLFDFSKIDFDKANNFALYSEVKLVCDLWEKYKDLDKIKEDVQLTLYTIKKYLNFGVQSNICKYDHEKCMNDRKEQRVLTGMHGRSIYVKCNETGEIFTNMKAASNKYKCNVPSYFYQNRTYAGQLSDGTKLTWTKIDNKAKQEKKVS